VKNKEVREEDAHHHWMFPITTFGLIA
jgi:hypothetical protein